VRKSTASNAAATPDENVGPALPARGLAGFFAKFTVLRGAQRELWVTFGIKFLIYTAYSVTNKTCGSRRISVLAINRRARSSAGFGLRR